MPCVRRDERTKSPGIHYYTLPISCIQLTQSE
jgi:hypothetical protein